MVQRLSLWIASVMCRLFFRRIHLMGAPLPRGGRPVMYVAALDNGAVDEWVLSFALRHFPTVLSPVPLERRASSLSDDDSEGSSYSAPREVVETLLNGGAAVLNISSTLPCPERFVEGIIRDIAPKCTDLLVVPIALFYESFSSWGSAVELVAGEPLAPAFLHPQEGMGALIAHELAVVEGRATTVSIPLVQAKQLAFLASCDDEAPYSLALRAVSHLPPHSPIMDAWRSFCGFFERHPFSLKFYGLPILSYGPLLKEAAEFLLAAPLLFSTLLMNALPAGIALLCSAPSPFGMKRGPEKQIVSGAIAFFLWAPLLWGCCVALGLSVLIPLHLLLTAMTPQLIYLFKFNGVRLFNGLRFPRMKAMQARLKEELRRLVL